MRQHVKVLLLIVERALCSTCPVDQQGTTVQTRHVVRLSRATRVPAAGRVAGAL